MKNIMKRFLRLKSKIRKIRAGRAIILNEHYPLKGGSYLPAPEYLAITDSLAKKRYRLRVDGNGFIMPSGGHREPDLSIVFLGGSNVECLFVEEDNRFPCLVGNIIAKEAGLRVNTYNATVSYNDSLQSINVLVNKILPIKPDIVVFMHAVSDINILIIQKTYWGSDPCHPETITNRFSFKDRVPPELRDKSGNDMNFNEDFIVAEHRAAIKTFIAICKNRGIVPVLMTEASRFTDNPPPIIKEYVARIFGKNGVVTYEAYRKLNELICKNIRMMGSEEGVPVIDLAAAVPRTSEYIYDLFHFNDEGSRFAAKIIARDILKLLPKI